ncbi:hypothetical protein ScPMuIL_017336 [Solemya velum]
MGRFVLGRVRFEISIKRLEANLPFLRHLVMSSIVVCNRTSRGKFDRIKLNLVNLKGRVISLKNEVAKAVVLQPRDMGTTPAIARYGNHRQRRPGGTPSHRRKPTGRHRTHIWRPTIVNSNCVLPMIEEFRIGRKK